MSLQITESSVPSELRGCVIDPISPMILSRLTSERCQHLGSPRSEMSALRYRAVAPARAHLLILHVIDHIVVDGSRTGEGRWIGLRQFGSHTIDERAGDRDS